jgi:tricorn protease
MHYLIPRLRATSTVLAALFAPALAHATQEIEVLKRFPHASAEQLVFVARGDLWRAPRNGGAAVRLTTTNMRPVMPRFSPDCQSIAFSAKSDGHQDVYVMPAAGGVPQRVTFHANRGRDQDDLVVTWTPDSKAIVFGSTIGAANSKDYRLFMVPIAGGLPQPLPMEHAGLMSYAQDANHLVYASVLNDFDARKRYNGGQAAELISFDLSTQTSKQLPHWKGNDTAPMWFDGKVYFVSDRDTHRRANLWVLDPATGKARQLTFFTDYDVDFPSLGGKQLTFQQGGKLYAIDLPSTQLREVKVTLPAADLVKTVDAAGFIRENDTNNAPAFALAPDGSAAMLSARGDLFHVATSGGVRLNLTATSGADEEHPAYSPDGATIAYITDVDGEQQLALRPAQGGPERIITHFKNGYLYAPVWTPDGKAVAVSDADKRLWHITLANGAARIIAQSKRQRIDDAAFSPDSRYLAFSIENDNQQRSIHLFDLNKMQDHVGSSLLNNDSHPVFSRDGRSLYFISSRHEFPVTSTSEEAFVTVNAQGIYVTTLRAPNAGAAGDIDFDGLIARTVPLPGAPGSYSSLTVSDTQLYYQSQPLAMIGGDLPGQEQSLHAYDLRTGTDRVVVSGFDTAVVSANGAALLYKQGNEWKYGGTAAGAPVSVLALSGMAGTVDLRQEWAEMFDRTWRLDRDFYLSATMNGIDWPAVGRAYAKFLPVLGSRDDLNYLIGQLQGELATSHMVFGGGDAGPHGNRPPAPRLGADYAFATLSGHYRFKYIYPGDNSRPELRSPLTEPGVDVQPGDYLLEINGKPLTAPQTPDSVLEGLTGPIELTVARSLQEAPRRVTVTPVASEFALREADMIEQNRRKVERLSNGRIGYLYMADFHQRGAEQFVRQFYPQMDKQGLIVDIRGNGGGFTSQQILARLGRHVAGLYVNRQGGRQTLPAQLMQGPMITLTNSFTSSDGDQFAYYFRQSGLGKVVGTRTWGGVRGVTSPLDLMDGGFLLVPKDVLYSPDSKWIIENVGAEPDVEVAAVPGESLHGRDKQLETAVEMLNRSLDRHPTVLPAAPPALPAYPPKGQVPGPSF